MKSVTEFFAHKLVKGIDSKTALAAEGKTPEEIEQSIGEAFKFEGDKLKHFINSLEVASANKENLILIKVVSLNEGETIPKDAIKVEEHYYIPSFRATGPAPSPVLTKPGKAEPKKKGKRKDGPRPSPWGISPEEEAAKKAAAKKKDQERTAAAKK